MAGTDARMRLRLDGCWLTADLGGPRQVLSFAPHRPGFVTAQHILIRYVQNDDLTPELDAIAWLKQQMARAGHAEDVAMLTSRRLQHHCRATAGLADCVATVGLGNAERIGQRRVLQPAETYGTINVALLVDAGLSQTAMIEALTIMAEARTAAIFDAGLRLPRGNATGTGTDCLALACDQGDLLYAGKHTELGEDIGRATYYAVLAGAKAWIAVHGDHLPD